MSEILLAICCTAPIWLVIGIVFSAWLTDNYFRKMFEVPADIAAMDFIKHLPGLILFEDRVNICNIIREEKKNGLPRISETDSQDSHLSKGG